MSREKKENSNEGLNYTLMDIHWVFFGLTRGIPLHSIAYALGRKEAGISLCWKRICWNATDYEDKRVYELTPPNAEPWRRMNGYLKDFIKIQMLKTARRSNPLELSQKTGLSLPMVTDFISKIKRYHAVQNRLPLEMESNF